MTRSIKPFLKKFLKGLGNVFKWIGIILALLLYIITGMIIFWLVRPNTSVVAPSLNIQNWVVVDLDFDDYKHNAFTDLIHWNNSFYLVHRSSPTHGGSKESKLMVWRSSDAFSWKLAKIIYIGRDIRDAKFAVIGSRLFIYALTNQGLIASPTNTLYTYTRNGKNWSSPKFIEHIGWRFWRPKTNDNKTWYVTACWHDVTSGGALALLNSTDGENWDFRSIIYMGERVNEADFEFFPDGRILVTARLEGSVEFLVGDNERASTVICVSEYPYKSWTYMKSKLTRLDGPCLFSHSGKIFAVGRFEHENDPLFNQRGGVLSRKRTALFLVNELGLVYLSDLPSAGDTSYSGAVVKDDHVYISYYTSDVNHDIPWIIGQISKSSIRIARVDINRLVNFADFMVMAGQLNNHKILELPIVDYIAFSLVLISEFSIIYLLRKYKQSFTSNKKRKTKHSRNLMNVFMI